MLLPQLPYEQIWCVDFEFRAEAGEQPVPVCFVGQELRSGRVLRLWDDQAAESPRPTPVPYGPPGAVRGLLRVGRVGMLQGPQLANAFADHRPVRRVPGADERVRAPAWERTAVSAAEARYLHDDHQGRKGGDSHPCPGGTAVEPRGAQGDP